MHHSKPCESTSTRLELRALSHFRVARYGSLTLRLTRSALAAGPSCDSAWRFLIAAVVLALKLSCSATVKAAPGARARARLVLITCLVSMWLFSGIDRPETKHVQATLPHSERIQHIECDFSFWIWSVWHVSHYLRLMWVLGGSTRQ